MTRCLSLGAVLALVAMLSAAPALAHKVIASAYPSGPVIEGEIGFSNGDMAANTLVEVFGPDGTKLGETTTDADGAFTFRPGQAVAHRFTADLGAGHKANFTMALEDIEQVLAMQQGAPAATATAPDMAEVAVSQPAQPVPAAGGPVELSMADKLAIAKMVRDEVRPVYKELAAYKEHNNLETILGGIGYIIGLFGIGFYVAARRKAA